MGVCAYAVSMDRRRLLWGLGAACLGSSATALTGATLSNTVRPASDFRISVVSDLVAYPVTTNMNIGGTSGNTTGDGVNTEDFYAVKFVAVPDLDENGTDEYFDESSHANVGIDNFNLDLNQYGVLFENDKNRNNDAEPFVVAVSIPLDIDAINWDDRGGVSRGQFEFQRWLGIKNTANFSQEVWLEFLGEGDTQADNGYGSDVNGHTQTPSALSPGAVGGDDTLAANQVAELFEFYVERQEDANGASVSGNHDKTLSPPGTGATPQEAANRVTLDPGGAVMLGLRVDLTRSQTFTNDAEDRLNTVAEAKQLLSAGGTIDLLDTLFIKAD